MEKKTTPNGIFPGTLGEKALQGLKTCEAWLDAYAQRVFEAHDENR